MLSFKILPNPIKLVFLTVCLTSLSNAGENQEEKKVRESFVRYFKEDEGKHQVMILFKESEVNGTIKQNDFITKISRHVPTILVSLQHLKNYRKNYVKHIGKNPRDTTLFVSMMENRRNSGFMDSKSHSIIIGDLSNQYATPKHLFVALTTNPVWDYRNFLKWGWLEQFLDLTYLKVLENGTSTEKGLFEQNQRFLTRYQLNGYTSIHSKELKLNHWIKSKWFPDKTKNLHKHPVILRMGRCDPEDFTIYKYFAESINATVQMGYTGAGFNCGNIISYHNIKQTHWHFSYFNNLEDVLAVVPRIRSYDKENLVSWKIVLLILTNVLLVIVLRLFSLFMKFDTDSWRMLDILIGSLGLNVHKVPKRVIERIVACCLFFGCIIYSGYLHTLLTEVELQAISEQEVKTLQDLVKLNLKLHTNVPFNGIEFDQALRNRLVHYKPNYQHYQCLQDLQKHKNVSCTFPLNSLLAIAKNDNGKHLIKTATIVKEPLIMGYATYLAQNGEALMGAFNKYLLRIIETGLMDKWGRYPSTKKPLFSTKIENSDVNTSGVLHRRLLLYLAFGYGVALIVFFCELYFGLPEREDLKQEILLILRSIKKTLSYMLQKFKRGCIWLYRILRVG